MWKQRFITLWTLIVPMLSVQVCNGELFEEVGVDPDGTITIMTEEACVDENEKCNEWMQGGECKANPGYMLKSCRKSCRICLPKDQDINLGEEQDLSDIPSREKMAEIMQSTLAYVRDEVWVKDEYVNVRDDCINRNSQCTFWAAIGECEANPKYMTLQCAPSCQTCHLIDIDNRCPIDPNDKDSLAPGDLDALFEKLANSSHYNPVVLSRPSHPASSEIDREKGQEDDSYHIGPWVMVFEHFLNDEECDTLIQLGAEQGYERSTDVGEIKFDGTFENHKSEGRTSENAWCIDECFTNATVQRVTEKIETLTGVPQNNSEYLQLLRYEEGQFYETHHDYIPYQKERSCGVRTLTLFLYLNDVEEGGGTNFPMLNDMTIVPNKGKALLWPSVLDSEPNKKDARTEHQALPVLKGVKYGANAWIHQRDFKTALEESCA